MYREEKKNKTTKPNPVAASGGKKTVRGNTLVQALQNRALYVWPVATATTLGYNPSILWSKAQPLFTDYKYTTTETLLTSSPYGVLFPKLSLTICDRFSEKFKLRTTPLLIYTPKNNVDFLTPFYVCLGAKKWKHSIFLLSDKTMGSL